MRFSCGSKNPPAMWKTWVQSLGWEDPLEEDMATHSSTLAWRIPWTEEPGELQSMGSQRVRHDWSDLAHTHNTFDHLYWKETTQENSGIVDSNVISQLFVAPTGSYSPLIPPPLHCPSNPCYLPPWLIFYGPSLASLPCLHPQQSGPLFSDLQHHLLKQHCFL